MIAASILEALGAKGVIDLMGGFDKIKTNLGQNDCSDHRLVTTELPTSKSLALGRILNTEARLFLVLAKPCHYRERQ